MCWLCCVVPCPAHSRLYKDDPTIIAWNLINEPRCESWLPANKDCNQRVQKWLVEMSKHVRSLDKNHLITIGSEGFYGDSTPKLLQYNPQAWAADMGQDFVMNTDIPDVDFATVHAWPDNCECCCCSARTTPVGCWPSCTPYTLAAGRHSCCGAYDHSWCAGLEHGRQHRSRSTDSALCTAAASCLSCHLTGMLTQERIPAFLDKWIQSHIAAGTNLTTGSKPIMFEEFGKKLEPKEQTSFMIEQLRDPVYTSTYASVESAINANQPIAGSMFWKMSIPVFDRQDPRGE